ncbi:MAG: hypothetical protein Q8O70_09255, partial [Burkholderiales bacterium]|nr:hypothetical protein [Burkholderiales bacterium]
LLAQVIHVKIGWAGCGHGSSSGLCWAVLPAVNQQDARPGQRVPAGRHSLNSPARRAYSDYGNHFEPICVMSYMRAINPFFGLVIIVYAVHASAPAGQKNIV